MIKQKWQELNDREKKLILTATIFIVLYLLYSVLFMQPIMGSKVAQNKKKFAELKPQIEKIKYLQQQARPKQKPPEADLLNFIKNNVETIDVANSNKAVIESQENGKAVLIKYESVAFDKLIQWLEKINAQFGLTVSNAKLEAIDKKSGYVSAELVITSIKL